MARPTRLISAPVKSEVVSVRLARADYEHVRYIARASDRPITTQCRVLIKTALNLSTPQGEDGPDGA